MKSIFVFLLLYSISGFATISNFTVNGSTYSRFVEENGTYYIYGGIAGTECSGTTTSTCSNCDGGQVACNPKRVHGNLRLSISFQSTTAGTACIMSTGTSPGPRGDVVTGVTANSTTTVTVDWDDLCNDIDGANGPSDCSPASNYTESAQIQYQVGIATDSGCSSLSDSLSFYIIIAGIDDTADPSESASIEDFVAYPGDEKVYLKDVISYSTTAGYSPEMGAADVNQIGAFYTLGGCAQQPSIGNDSPSHFTSVTADGEIDDERVRNLINGQEYVFVMAVKDDAENIGFFTNTACIAEVHTATPDEVYGLLENEKNCFIATAAFGSSFDHHVQSFRDFRNRYLQNSALGQKIIRVYYKYSPPLADFISQNEYLRAGARVVLLPFWGIAWLYLNVGAVSANLILAVILSGLIFSVRVLKKAKS